MIKCQLSFSIPGTSLVTASIDQRICVWEKEEKADDVYSLKSVKASNIADIQHVHLLRPSNLLVCVGIGLEVFSLWWPFSILSECFQLSKSWPIETMAPARRTVPKCRREGFKVWRTIFKLNFPRWINATYTFFGNGCKGRGLKFYCQDCYNVKLLN